MRIKDSIINQTTLILFILFCAWPNLNLMAQETPSPEPTQSDIDESFDPFADYNEYDQQSEEESDINFLKNGRYLTLSFISGYRTFVGGGLSEAYKPNLHYGAEFSYFFNLNLAIGLSFLLSDHNVNFTSYTNQNFSQISRRYDGNVNLQNIDFHFKYYFNTDNITKGLADLNPYGFLGTSYNIRTYTLDETLGSASDNVWGFKFGGGIELPLLKNSAYYGAQLTYRYVQFPDENKSFIEEDDDSNNTKPIKPRLDGDILDLSFILGLNF